MIEIQSKSGRSRVGQLSSAASTWVTEMSESFKTNRQPCVQIVHRYYDGRMKSNKVETKSLVLDVKLLRLGLSGTLVYGVSCQLDKQSKGFGYLSQ